MSSVELIAHSENDGYASQTYEVHILGMKRLLKERLEKEAAYCPISDDDYDQLISAIEAHDMGKLTNHNQKVLRGEEEASRLPDNHVDIGTTYMKQEGQYLAAVLVASHHRGLPNIKNEVIKKVQKSLMSKNSGIGDEMVSICTDRILALEFNNGH